MPILGRSNHGVVHRLLTLVISDGQGEKGNHPGQQAGVRDGIDERFDLGRKAAVRRDRIGQRRRKAGVESHGR